MDAHEDSKGFVSSAGSLDSCRKLNLEIVIVDDNSPDGTQDVVRDLQKVYGHDKIILHGRPGKMGLGSAYIDGLGKCSGDFVILMDADLSHHVSIPPLIIDTYSLNLYQSLSKSSSRLV